MDPFDHSFGCVNEILLIFVLGLLASLLLIVISCNIRLIFHFISSFFICVKFLHFAQLFIIYSFTQTAYLFCISCRVRSGANTFLEVMNGELLSFLKIKLCFECLLEIKLKLYLGRSFAEGFIPPSFFRI